MYVNMKDNKRIYVNNGQFWQVNISLYGKEQGRLDYYTMIKALTYDNYIFNNNIIGIIDDFEVFNGTDYDEETNEYYDVFQYYIIDEQAAKNLQKFTDELVYYSPKTDLYLLGVCHWGTSWDYVLTDYEIVNNE